MADDRHYTITITDTSSSDPKQKPISGDTSENKQTGGITSDNGVYGWLALKRVTPYVKQAISYTISQVSVRTGRREQQQRTQFAFDVLNEVGGIAQTIYFGAKWGGPPGAAIAAGVSALNVGLNIFQRFDALATQTNLENASLGLSRVRSNGIAIFSDNSR